MATSDAGPSSEAGLRAEHDALARKLAVRRSVDAIRAAAYTGFSALLALALTLKFAWDRWGTSRVPRPAPRGRYPILVLLALLLFGVLFAYTVRFVRRARALRAEEGRLILRFEELRRALGLDP